MTGPLSTREACVRADLTDPLRRFRDEFDLPSDVIYLDGNSLGAAPCDARRRAHEVLDEEWATGLIRSWNTHHWFDLPTRIGDKIGRLIGGGPGTCVVTDSTSVNLFKVLSAALRMQEAERPGRRTIISERDSFPTDLYIVQGIIEMLGQGYELQLIDADTPLESLLDDRVAAVLLTHVNYRTGALWDLPATTQHIHDSGALAIWDLCHSVGAVPVDLEGANADFAVGCTYKYLNGGPGAPAFVWVADRHQHRAQQPLSGWWGHGAPFAMAPAFTPADGIRRFLTGTQPILSLATMEVGIDIALRVDQRALREKSMQLTALFIELVESRLAHHPLTLVTPRDPEERGSHVSFRHPEGYAVMSAMIHLGVIGDYREPEVLRFGMTPLYTSYADVWDAVDVLRRVLDEQLWRAPEFSTRGAVT